MFCKVARTGLFFVCLSPAAIFWRERPSEWPVSSAHPMHLEGSSRSDVLPGGIPSPDFATAWSDVWAKLYGSVLGQGPSRLELFRLLRGHRNFIEDGFTTTHRNRPRYIFFGIQARHCFKCFKCDKALWLFPPKTITSMAKKLWCRVLSW